MAYKEKEHDYKKLEREISDGTIAEHKVMLLYGHEDYLVKNYEKRIRDIYVEPATAELDYAMLDGEDITVDDIISHVDTLPMLSQKRVVAVRNYPALVSAAVTVSRENTDTALSSDSETKRLAEYLDDIPDTSLLIFVNENVDTRKSLSKKIGKSGKIYNFEKLDRKDLSSFIKKRFKIEGKHIDDSVIREIINTTGYFDRDSDYTLNGIAGDVVKIASFSNEQQISGADVSNVLSTSLETDAFAMLDSLSRGNRGDAMLLVNNIMDSGESGFKLLGLIISQFELMFGIKEYSARGSNKSEIMNELGVKSEFRYKKAAEFANTYSQEKLGNILKKLYEVEKNIKTGIYNEKLAMTMFVAGI